LWEKATIKLKAQAWANPLKGEHKMATYKECLEKRLVLKNFPETANKAVGDLWEKIAGGYDIDTDDEKRKIADLYGVSFADVSVYYNWYATDRPSSIVIFYNESKKLAGQSCFESRWNNQLLPRGSVVCAFVTNKGVTTYPPYLSNETMEDEFKAEMQTALLSVGQLDLTIEDIIKEGSVLFPQ
jgi:hypothetical protein